MNTKKGTDTRKQAGDDETDYTLERIQFLVNGAFSSDDGTGKSFAMAVGLIQGVLDGRC